MYLFGVSVFSGCTNLESISIANLEEINNLAFYNCSKLENVILPDNLTVVGYQAFAGCSSLKTISIPSNTTILHDKAFAECSSLEEVVLPNDTKLSNIGWDCFCKCTKLSSFTIPKTMTLVEDGAFLYCTSLTDVYLDSYTVTFEDGTFSFSGITNLYFGYDISYWCYLEFESESASPMYDAKNLYCLNSNNEYYIPTSVSCNLTELSKYQYAFITSLETITLTNTKIIGVGAFKGCTGLKSITIPSGVTAIPHYCFEGCTSLKNVYLSQYLSTIGKKAFYQCESLNNIMFPSNLSYIDYMAFWYTGLTSVEISTNTDVIDAFDSSVTIKRYS